MIFLSFGMAIGSRKGCAPVIVAGVLAFSSSMASSEQPPKSFCFDGNVCSYPTAGEQRFNQKALLRLGCQPLAVLRARILVDRGACLTDALLRQLFNQSCVASKSVNDAAHNAVSPTDWELIRSIEAVERMKKCVIRD